MTMKGEREVLSLMLVISQRFQIQPFQRSFVLDPFTLFEESVVRWTT